MFCSNSKRIIHSFIRSFIHLKKFLFYNWIEKSTPTRTRTHTHTGTHTSKYFVFARYKFDWFAFYRTCLLPRWLLVLVSVSVSLNFPCICLACCRLIYSQPFSIQSFFSRCPMLWIEFEDPMAKIISKNIFFSNKRIFCWLVFGSGSKAQEINRWIQQRLIG